ncbi:MAG: GNAT family N-acetyltransferase [Candidatus Cloacimonetes bacterium]|nr:GNAT family N-acetyltransferase [Candidatus Cloacimonadota bacterium]
MHFKKLIGEKVFLSPINPGDAEKFTTWLNDLEVTQFLTISHRIYSLVKEQAYLDNKARSDAYAFSILDDESKKLIGVCELFDVNWINGTAELGIFIGDKNFWGRGFGRDAITLLLDFGFNLLNLRNIMLWTDSFNPRGIKCYTSCGFQEVGLRRNARTIAGETHDMLMMDITNDDFEGAFVKGVFEKARSSDGPTQLEIVT